MRDFLQGDNFYKGLLLSTICFLLLVPSILWGYLSEHARVVIEPGMLKARIFADTFLIWVAMQISATAGFAWAIKLGLAGFEKWSEFKKNLFLAIAIGLGIAVIEAIIFDMWLLKPMVKMSSANPFMSGKNVVEELILRFGIMTMAFRLVRKTWVAIFIAALFNVMMAVEGTISLKVTPPTGLMAIAIVKISLLSLLYGYLCARKGLLSDMTVRFVAGMKFLVYFLIK
jgi:hypothetical protein